MFPVPADQTNGGPSTQGDRCVGHIPPVVGRKPDHCHHTPGPDQVGKPDEAVLRVDVMERRNRHHGVEGTALERHTKDVPGHPFDGTVSVTRSRSLENAGVQIEANNAAHSSLGQLRGQDAITTTHIQNALRWLRNRPDEQRMVLDVGIPKPFAFHISFGGFEGDRVMHSLRDTCVRSR